MTHPLARTEERWRVEYKSEVAAFEIEKEKAELRRQGWREKFKNAAKKGSAELPVEPDRTLSEPRQRRLILTDSTFEKLHEILADNPAGVLVARDELPGWLSTLDRQGREGDRAFYLQAWNGKGGFTVDRIGRGSIHVPACCVSLLGNFQPSRLRWYLSQALEGGPSDDGLIQRLQITVWPNQPGAWKPIDRSTNGAALEQVARVFEELADMPADEPLSLRFAEDAQELFFAWWSELEAKLRSDSLAPARSLRQLLEWAVLLEIAVATD